MKGPSGRLKFDVRRQWQCPRCKMKHATGGEVVNCICLGCSTEEPLHRVWMRLLEENTGRDESMEKEEEQSE